MSDLISSAVQFVMQHAASSLSRTVTYSRGSTELEISAVIGQADYEIEDETGVRTVATIVDFVITDAAAFAAAFHEPAAGDQVTDGDVVYEVLALPGMPAWRWATRYRRAIRVHTKELSDDG